MAITTPTSLQVPAEYETMLPAMAKQPLKKLLEDLNYLYTSHRPPLGLVCFTTAPTLSRETRLVQPIMPSADGIKYKLESRVYCNGACNLSLVLEYCTSYAYNSDPAWTNLADHTGAHVIAVGAAGLVTQVDTVVIPANATAVRMRSSVSASSHNPHSLLVYPYPDAPVVTTYPSGFVLFDDGLLNSGQHAPITTEHLNRCRVSPDAIRRDRVQCLYSFGQEEVVGNTRCVLDNITTTVHFPTIRCWLPAQGLGKLVEITVQALVATDNGSDVADAVGLQQLAAGTGVTFDAQPTGSLAIQSATFQVSPQQLGGGDPLLRFVDLELWGKTASTKKTYILAVVAFWRPGD